MQRRLTTILAGDVVGFSSRVADDETGTLQRLDLLRQLVQTEIENAHGRVVSWAGDGFLAEFSSPVDAVRTGWHLQQELTSPLGQTNIDLQLRLGIHLADVIAQDNDILGEGVNLASRIEAEAEPGKVYLSRTVFEMVKAAAQLRFEPRGTHPLKGFANPVELYCVVGELGYHSLMPSQQPSQPRQVAPTQMRSHVVVVLPFLNRSTDPEQEFFADGFTEDLITEVARFTDMEVISRSGSFALKNTDASVAQVCGITGARYCVEGGVRRMGPNIRLTARLTDGLTGQQVWSEYYDFPEDELFQVQDDLLGRIASAVRGKVESSATAEAERKRPKDMEAFDCFLRGMSYHRMGGITQENAEEAIRWFDRAIEKDPTFGRVYAWKACAVATRAEWSHEDYMKEAWALGRKALALDPGSAEVHRILGSLNLYEENYESSLYHYNRALELTPNHAYVVAFVGAVHCFLGDAETALLYQRRAERLDPFLPEYCREIGVMANWEKGDFEACYQEATAFPRITRRAAAYRVAAALHLDREDRLTRAAARLMTIDPEFDPELFIEVERYKDRSTRRRLKTELAGALDLARSRLTTGAPATLLAVSR